MEEDPSIGLREISMEEPIRRLAELESYIPNDTPTLNGILFEYGRFLVSFLSPALSAKSFYRRCTLALYSLQRGRHEVTSEPLRDGLAGHSPIIYSLLERSTPLIADAIFPEDFAQEVKQYIQEVENSH